MKFETNNTNKFIMQLTHLTRLSSLILCLSYIYRNITFFHTTNFHIVYNVISTINLHARAL